MKPPIPYVPFSELTLTSHFTMKCDLISSEKLLILCALMVLIPYIWVRHVITSKKIDDSLFTSSDDTVHSVKEAIFFIYTNKLTSALLIVFITVAMFLSVCDLNYTVSASMYPTISIPAISITNDLAYIVKPVQRGDIISFYHEESIFGKRVIGIEGDQIEFHDGYVYINGIKHDEPYLSEDVETNCNRTFVVPENCVFVLGDNREISNDSRSWDNPYVPVNKIKGKIVFILNLD